MYKKISSSICLLFLLFTIGCTDATQDAAEDPKTGDEISEFSTNEPANNENNADETPDKDKSDDNIDSEENTNASDNEKGQHDTASERTPYIQVDLSMTINEAMKEFKDPLKKKTTDRGTVSLFYQEQGKGIVFQQSMKDGSLQEITFYPQYLDGESFTSKGWKVPANTESMKELLGSFDKKDEVQCYESAKCNEYQYKRANDIVVVRTNWDKETIEYVKITKE